MKSWPIIIPRLVPDMVGSGLDSWGNILLSVSATEMLSHSKISSSVNQALFLLMDGWRNAWGCGQKVVTVCVNYLTEICCQCQFLEFIFWMLALVCAMRFRWTYSKPFFSQIFFFSIRVAYYMSKWSDETYCTCKGYSCFKIWPKGWRCMFHGERAEKKSCWCRLLSQVSTHFHFITIYISSLSAVFLLKWFS